MKINSHMAKVLDLVGTILVFVVVIKLLEIISPLGANLMVLAAVFFAAYIVCYPLFRHRNVLWETKLPVPFGHWVLHSLAITTIAMTVVWILTLI